MTRNYQTILDAFHKTSAQMDVVTSMGEVNVSSIATKLIQNVGRYCDNYASDFLITWKSIEECLNAKYNGETRDVFAFGIRQLGVDGNDYIVNRLREWDKGFYPYDMASLYYRKILAVEIHKGPYSLFPDEIMTTVTLKDITGNVKLSDFDKD